MVAKQQKNGMPAATDILKWALVIIVFTVLVTLLAQMKPSTRNFVKEVSISNEFEIESSKLALQKSQNPEVKEFAQEMINEHTRLGNEFKSAVAASTASNGDLEKSATGMDKKHERMLAKLNEAEGNKFDKEYIAAQKDVHKKAERLFSKYSKHGEDEALQTFADKNHEVIQKHLEHIKNIKL